VDDQVSNRMIAKYFVESEGHTSIEAVDGQDAIEKFRLHTPDLVLMDILMPVMDGYESASAIKALVGDVYVPIIFLTAKHDETSLQKCLECGGDDYLIKPINGNLLKAKIKAHARTQELTQQVKAKNDELVSVYAKLTREHEMGMHVLSHTLEKNLKACPNIRQYMSSMSTFNGDIFLLAENPQGGLYVFLGDFTGHGLAAAIGTIPLSQLFFSMCDKGDALSDIVRAMNRSLKTFLPAHMFCAATFIHLFERGDSAHIWAGGLPDAYVIRQGQGVVDSICSQYLPLGILDDDSFNSEAKFYRFEPEDKLILFSDGILEGSSANTGEMFGEHRLKSVLNNPSEDAFSDLIRAYQSFVGEQHQDDDLSLIEVTAKPYETRFIRELFCNVESRLNFLPWKLTLQLTAKIIRHNDGLNNFFALLPSAIRVSYRFDILRTIMSELYANALEHGLLMLDSAMKATREGFEHYYHLREQRLAALEEGYIKIELQTFCDKGAIKIRIIIEDSGEGFNFQALQIDAPEKVDDQAKTRPWGRGLELVRSFSESLNFSKKGSRVEVMFLLS
jgi:CheY-like chemotaxis protein